MEQEDDHGQAIIKGKFYGFRPAFGRVLNGILPMPTDPFHYCKTNYKYDQQLHFYVLEHFRNTEEGSREHPLKIEEGFCNGFGPEEDPR